MGQEAARKQAWAVFHLSTDSGPAMELLKIRAKAWNG